MPFTQIAETDLAPAGFQTVDESQLAQTSPTALPTPSAAEALGRGALQGISLGFSDEITGALESVFGAGYAGAKTYTQARDEARAANEAAKQAHGGFYLGGEIGGGLASALVPGLGVARGASLAASAGKAALAGGLSGLGSSNADLTKNEFGQAALDTAKGALAGAVIGGVTHGIGSAIAKAPAKAEEQMLEQVYRGEGTKGAAIDAVRKQVVANKDNVIEALQQKFVPEEATKAITLKDLLGKPAKDMLNAVDNRLEQLGPKLDPLYNVMNKSTGGGASVGNMIETLDQEIKNLSGQPGNENTIKAIESIKDNILKAWAPDMEQELNAAKRLSDMGLQNRKVIEDVMVPFQDLRKYVSTLYKRGNPTIQSFNPGEAMIVKREMHKIMDDILNTQLDAAAERATGPEATAAVAAIRELNRPISGLKTIQAALEQRAEKEATGHVTGKGLLHGMLGHGGLVGAGALAMHGNIPGAVLAAATPKVLEKLPAMGRSLTRAGARASSLIQQLSEAAAAGNPWAKAQLAAMQGLPGAGANIAGQELASSSGASEPNAAPQ